MLRANSAPPVCRDWGYPEFGAPTALMAFALMFFGTNGIKQAPPTTRAWLSLP